MSMLLLSHSYFKLLKIEELQKHNTYGRRRWNCLKSWILHQNMRKMTQIKHFIFCPSGFKKVEWWRETWFLFSQLFRFFAWVLFVYFIFLKVTKNAFEHAWVLLSVFPLHILGFSNKFPVLLFKGVRCLTAHQRN